MYTEFFDIGGTPNGNLVNGCADLFVNEGKKSVNADPTGTYS